MSTDDLDAELGALIGGARQFSAAAPSSMPPVVLAAFTPNEGQRAAIDRIAAWRADRSAPRVMALTGPAGTGKSTVMQAVRNRLRGTRTAWSAMTGKAASRLREASGVAGKTTHSQLYHPPREVDNMVDQKIDLDFAEVKHTIGDESCLLVVDEASMIGPRLCADIERSSYDKVLLVGDPYQIPPVLSKTEEKNQGDDYSVFADIDCAHLTEVMRTAGAVLRAATRVREERQIPIESENWGGSEYTYESWSGHDEAMKRALSMWLGDREDHVLITWRNETRMLASRVIRAKLGHTSMLPEKGEPLVVRRNVYGTELMNGDMVHVEEWLEEGPTLAGIETRYLLVKPVLGGRCESLLVPTQKFDGTMPYVGLAELRRAVEKAGVDDPTPVTFGYCLTGHLAQGSEYRRVTTFLPGDLRNAYFRKQTRLPTGETMPFSMRFLYTALARAKQHTTLIVA